MKINYKLTSHFIADLERIFPAIEIEPDTGLQEVYFNAGVRKVIDTLKRMKEKQDREVN